MWIATLLFATSLLTTPSVDDVLTMMARVPNECALYSNCPKTWGPPHYESLNDAREIATAIAAGVVAEADPWGRAALGVIYAAFESNNRRCASGDGGKSWGAWQMQRVNNACTPLLAFPMWLAKVENSEKTCVALPPEDRLAALASGNCDHGRDKVRHRWALVPQVEGRALD
jgi:hypothetical protein